MNRFRDWMLACLGGIGLGLAADAQAQVTTNIQFTAATTVVSEGGTNVTLVVTRTPAIGTSSVSFDTVPGSALPGADYIATNGTLTFGPGEVSKLIMVALVDDLISEPSETFSVVLSNPVGGTIGVGTNLVTIADDDSFLGFSATTYSVTEGISNAVVSVVRTGGTDRAASVEVRTANLTATAGSDYLALTTTLFFVPGQTTNTALIPILDDCAVEPAETFRVYLTNAVGAFISSPSNATVSILDNDSANGTFAFDVGPLLVAENVGTVAVSVNRQCASVGAVSVQVAPINVPLGICPLSTNAIPNVDYSGGTITLNWAAGDPTPKTFNITITNDNLVELDEQIVLGLFNPTGGATINSQLNTYTIRILFDDQPAGAADRTYNPVFPSNPTPGANSVVYATAVHDGTNDVNRGKTTIGGEFTAVNAVIRNRVARLNTDGSVDPTFNPGTGADAFVSSVVVQPDGRALIGGGFTSFNGIDRHHVARLNVDGSLDTTFNPGAGANGPVYAVELQADGRVLIAGDFTSVNNIPRNRIARLNTNGVVDLSFTPGGGADAPIWTAAVEKRFSSITINGSASGGSEEARTNIVVGTGFGTLTINYDFLSVPDTLRVYYGATRIFDTGLTNGASTVVVPFGPGVQYGPGQFMPAATNIQIVVNEGSGQFGTFWQYDATILLAGGGGKIVVGGEFTSFDGVPRNRVARLNADGTLDSTFDSVSGANDTVYTAILDANGLAYIGGAFSVFDGLSRNGIARLRPDGFLDPSFNPGTGAAGAVYAIRLQTNGQPVIGGQFGSYNDTPRTNVARLYTDGTLDTSFLDNLYNQTQPGPDGFLNAVGIQPDGNVIIGGSFMQVGGGFAATDVTHAFNVARLIGGTNPPAFNMPGNVQFISSTFSVDENVLGGQITVIVQRLNGVSGPLLVDFTTADGSAHAGVDYVPTSGTLLFGDCDSLLVQQFISVPILDNTMVDGNRSFKIVLSNPRSGSSRPLPALGFNSTAVVTIVDNDFNHGVLSFSSPVIEVGENLTNAVVTVVRTNGSTGTVTVQYATSDGTALASADYQSRSGTLTFGPGITSRTITVPIVNDTGIEGEEFFQIRLFSPGGGATLGLTNMTVLILDDESGPGSLSFASPSGYSVNEAGGTATITVRRTSGASGTATVSARTVQFGIAPGQARDGFDYVGTTNVLTFGPGVTAQTFTVAINTDNFVEGDEVLGLELFNVSGATLGFLTNSTLTIKDANSYGSLSFADVDFFINEAAQAGGVNITVVRTGGTSEEVSVGFGTQAGSAVPGVDYVETNGVLTFPNGAVSASFFVPVINDAMLESNKTVVLHLTNFFKAAPGSITNATLTIIDDESLALPAGSVDTTFAPVNADNFINAVGVQDGGKLIIGGNFSAYNGQALTRVGRVNEVGGIDPLFTPGLGANDTINALLVQPDQQIVIAGNFTSFDLTNRNRIARLKPDGRIDSSFNPGSGADSPIFGLAQRTDGRIVAGGAFSTFNGFNRRGVVQLNPNGSVDASFSPGAGINGSVYAVALQADGKILVGGEFTQVNTTNRSRLARLNADGSLDLAFDPGSGADGPVRALVVQPDGRILVGGSFTNFNGQSRGRLARVNGDGSLDPTFLPSGTDGAYDHVLAVALLPDGRIVVGGDFIVFNGVSRNRVAQLNSDGTIDPTINFGTGANSFVGAIRPLGDGRLVLAGGFTEFDGFPRNQLVRLLGGSNPGSGQFEFLSPQFSVSEGGTFASITVRRIGGASGASPVNFTATDGTAVSPADYFATNGTLTFAPGEVIRTFNVFVVNNTTVDPDRTVQLKLDGVSTNLGTRTNATLTIVNDDVALAFATASYSVVEGVAGGQATIQVVRSGALDTTVSVSVFTDTNNPGNTATAGADYALTNGTLTFLPGEVGRVFSIPVVDDSLVEVPETVALGLSNAVLVGSGTATVSLGLNAATLTIFDNDLAPGAISFSSTNLIVDESAGFATITLIRTNGTLGAVSVLVSTSGGTATAGQDYAALNNRVTFADGETVKTIQLPIFNDPLVEGTETVNLLLGSPLGGVGIGPITVSELIILDDDVEFQFTSPVFTVDETGGLAAVTVERRGGTNSTVTVDFATTSTGTAVAGADYLPLNGTLTFLPGETNHMFTVTILDDTFIEGTETIGLQLFNPTAGALLGTNATAEIDIIDNDSVVNFSSATYTVNETATNVQITLVRTGNLNFAATVVYAVTSGTASNGLDFVGTTNTVNFAAGDTNQTFLVQVLNDTLVEGDETVNLNLVAVTGGSSLGGLTNAVLTIQDDDFYGSISFSSATYSNSENVTTAVITVVRTNGAAGSVSVNFATADGTAISTGTNADYVPASGVVVFADGQTNASFTVTIINDSRIEPDETLALFLSNPAGGAALGSPNAATLTIVNDDFAGSLQFTSSSYSVNEAAGVSTISVSRVGGTAGPVSVSFAATAGTASAGADFTAISGVLNWADGDAADKTFQVQIANDNVGELDETVNLTLSNAGGGASLGAPAAAVLTITDDDRSVGFSSSSYTVNEAAGAATITVNRFGVASGAVSVSFSTTNGTATAGVDYTNVSGSVSWADGDLLPKTFTIPIVNDTLVEGDETVILSLSSPVGATLVSSTPSTLTIVDDDASATFVGAGAVLLTETGGTANGAVDPGETVTLSFALRNVGSTTTSNLTATLLATNGVTNPDAPKNYGAVIAGGPAVAQNFTFTATGTNGGTITAVLQLQDGATSHGAVPFVFNLGSRTNRFINSTAITINDNSPASPYPSSILVSGVAGSVSKVTVTLSNLSHTFPADVDVLLVSPTGQRVIVMSDAGSSSTSPNPVNNVTLTFDDDAASGLPQTNQIVSGTFRPTNFSPAEFFPPPAPAAPFSATLSAFNGINPNGTWSLYVLDDNGLDFGSIASGWSLDIIEAAKVNPPGDLGVTVTDAPDPVVAGQNVTYTLTATNAGSSTAQNVVLTNTLPVGLAYAAITNGFGTYYLSGSTVIFQFGNIAAGGSKSVTVVASTASPGSFTDAAAVTSTLTDLVPGNNTASATTTVFDAANLGLTLVDSPDPVAVGSNLTFEITVTNRGPSAATSVVVTNLLPASVNFVSVVASQGNASSAGG
ncbi:MAG TPA: Calx-beta domain-containing protein, partial [Verrucomicrobiae bacterium]